ncbi:MAG: malate synthase G [Colwellia sp.]
MIATSNTVQRENLQINETLYQFIEDHALLNTGINSETFWQGFSKIIHDLSSENKALLIERDAFQEKIDIWHKANLGQKFNFGRYKSFLQEINYLEPVVDDFAITTESVDAELASIAGPQLVVPIMNARFALNAVNARWGSLYDALYGSDVISDADGGKAGKGYNEIRGKRVIGFAKTFLDESLPLATGSHKDVVKYRLTESQLVIELSNGEQTQLQDNTAFVGYSGEKDQFNSLVFKHNNLHIEIIFDAKSAIASSDAAGVSDVRLESALTTIMDCEDSVAAVDGEDKVLAYQNWLGLMQGTLSTDINKQGKTFTRKMNKDKPVNTLNGECIHLKARSLMFVRNVGHLMTNNAIIDSQGNEVPEGIMDAMITSLIALHDIKRENELKNSTQASIYIVKPKMHGSKEVKFADTLFSRVEDALSLPRNTIKMGIMDEERRTSINLKNCIHSAKDRVVFINTGFLDRTGDEIHTSMAAGPMARKGDIKLTPWIGAYENNNVDIGLACGFSQKAQIGKGMWPIPDQMANMIATKINHVEAGANTAWVPSPTAATLHALHYHKVDVFSLQQQLMKREPANLDDILTIPLAEDTNWTKDEITQELDNNAQGILGYVVRWVDQGVGCSKVPDINNVGLMEDRATLRISSQHIANWLLHGICSKDDVLASLKKMAKIVDEQNADDSLYQAMSDDFEDNIAFKAACALIFDGINQPNGYTEPLLHQCRLEKKRA